MPARAALVLVALLLVLHSPGQQQRDAVLDRIISVQATNQYAADILEQISREQGIYFSYNAALTDTLSGKITISAVNKTVREILHELFPGKEIRLAGRENHIIISAQEETPEQLTAETDTIPVKLLHLRGRVISSSNRNPVEYATVSLLGKPIGTITNRDGDYLLKLPEENLSDTVVFSCLGYARRKAVVADLLPEQLILLTPISIRIKEVQVKAISVEDILEKVRQNIVRNYPENSYLLSGFYRETLQQDEAYINVSEAALEILKAPYDNMLRDDKVRLIKARRSPDVKPFHWVNFKLQGGPFTITQLDVVKTMETFIDREFQHLYKYSLNRVVWYENRPAFEVRFRPVKNISFPCFRGEMYIDRESYAILFARFSLDDYGLNMAEQSLIRKKPKGYKVKPVTVDYQVSYYAHHDKWLLHTARASVEFRVKNRQENFNSVFHSISDLLVTNAYPTDLKRFPVKELFTINDIFVEIDFKYDEDFWGAFNIIKPNEDLRNAIKNLVPSKAEEEEEEIEVPEIININR